MRPRHCIALVLFAAACNTGGATPDLDGGVADAAPPADLGVADGASSSDLAGEVTTGSLQIIVEPGDHGAALQNAITGAQQSVHMTMYLLSSTDIVNALVARKQAGLEVKVVLNKSFPSSSTSNQATYDTLKTAGVSVVWAPSGFTYTHEKCVLLDGKTAFIMTMNATHSSPTANREYLAIDTDAIDVAEAEAIFAADYAGQAWSPSGALVVSPVNSRDRIVALIDSATSTVDLEGEELSDSKVVAALTARKSAGVLVRVVLADQAASSSQSTAIATLKSKGIPVVAVSTPYIHAKAVVVDGKSAFVGSENFSTGSLQYNRELGIIFSVQSEVAKVSAAIASDFAVGTAL